MSPITSIVPVAIVLAIEMGIELVADMRRFLLDKETNDRPVKIL